VVFLTEDLKVVDIPEGSTVFDFDDVVGVQVPSMTA
jgi:hypothetical protein